MPFLTWFIYLYFQPHQTHAPKNREKDAVSGEELKDLFIKPNSQSLFTTKKLLVKNGREAKGCWEIDLFLIRLPLKDSYMECSFGEEGTESSFMRLYVESTSCDWWGEERFVNYDFLYFLLLGKWFTFFLLTAKGVKITKKENCRLHRNGYSSKQNPKRAQTHSAKLRLNETSFLRILNLLA